MPVEFTFSCSLASGLHARPAARFAEVANLFVSDCLLTNLRTGLDANLKSPLSMLAAYVRAGDSCRIQVAGSDEEAALAALRNFAEQELPKLDESLPASSRASTIDSQPAYVPHGLKPAVQHFCFGRAVQRGLGQGRVVRVGGFKVPSFVGAEGAEDPSHERQRMRNALANVQSHIRKFLALPGSATQEAMMKAQLAIACDISLIKKLDEKISQGKSAGQSLLEAGEFFLGIFQQAESAYLQERALDFKDVLHQLFREIYGAKLPDADVELSEPAVIVAETLSPQQLLSLDREWLQAIVLESAGATAHAVILARSLGIPTLVGVKDALRRLAPGEEVVVDANRSFLVPADAPAVRRFYVREGVRLQRRRDRLAEDIAGPATTRDGHTLEIGANVAGVEELAPAFEQGADGIGLFRTEGLFLGKESTPTEEEQFAIYAQAARLAGSRTVILRTFDLGADKPARWLNLPREDNPFLGYRGTRLYPGFPNLLRTQMRAMLRASALGRVQMMIPMVCSLEEVLWVKARLAEAQVELQAENIGFNPTMPIGIMIETPAAGYLLDTLCQELDFFSIGTNDLSQYFFAADRGNSRVGHLALERQPAFLRFLRQIVGEIRTAGKWVGMCGEMAADPRNLPLLAGLGLNEISAPASEIAPLKKKLRRLDSRSCETLLAKAATRHNVGEVEDLLRQTPLSEGPLPLFSPELVIAEGDCDHLVCEDKNQAIQEMVEALYLAGRTESPQEIEKAIWDREALSSTGLGFGFAIPHCKTDAMATGSVVILKLREPIPWGSLDDEPVRMVLLLAVRESQAGDAYLRILSRLARKLMDAEFRAGLLALDGADAIVSYVSRESGVE